jgi:hypothetical protein
LSVCLNFEEAVWVVRRHITSNKTIRTR